MKPPFRMLCVLALQAGLIVQAAMAAPQQEALSVPSLSTRDAADLTFMREEEKLARDFYAAMATQWELRSFANIRLSEQQHTDVMASLLRSHGLPDPAATLPAGRFNDVRLQTLFDSLHKEGSSSRQAALKLGTVIEEIDIRDLDERIAVTQAPDLRAAYERLREASWQHLASFVRQLQREGLPYAPQYLDAATVNTRLGL